MSDASLLDRWARHDLGLRVVVTGMVLMAVALLVAAISEEPRPDDRAGRSVASTTSAVAPTSTSDAPRPVPTTAPTTSPPTPTTATSAAPTTTPSAQSGSGLTVRTDDVTAASCAAGTYAVVAASAALDDARRLAAEAVALTGRGAYLVADSLCGEPESDGDEMVTVVVGPFDSRAVACEVFWKLWGPLDAPNATFWRIDDLAAPVGAFAFPCPLDLAGQGATPTSPGEPDPATGAP